MEEIVQVGQDWFSQTGPNGTEASVRGILTSIDGKRTIVYLDHLTNRIRSLSEDFFLVKYPLICRTYYAVFKTQVIEFLSKELPFSYVANESEIEGVADDGN